MQRFNTAPISIAVTGRCHPWPVFALSILLAACQPSRADPPAAVQAPAPAHNASHRMETTATPCVTSSTNSSNTPLLDDDGTPCRPDDSYYRANLRAQYKTCITASGGVTTAIQACMDEEFHWQDQRLQNAWGVIADGPDSEYKDKLADEQATYMRDTNRYCRFDPSTQNQGQMLDTQSCRINRYANRADVLETLINK